MSTMSTTEPTRPMPFPHLFRDRSRPAQVLLGGVIPAALGAVAGVILGVSAGAYYAFGGLVTVGSFVSGFEHRDGWGGADRGFWAGAFYGTALLLMHALVATSAKASLGSFPPFLVVITTIVAMLSAAAGGRLARFRRERAGVFITDEPEP